MNSKKQHWEDIYAKKSPDEVSWTQDYPYDSLKLIKEYSKSKKDKIIDIGGGDSKFVDFLLSEGYSNISVLDISKNAIERVKSRLGNKAELVNWIHTDVLEFSPKEQFDIWHDRAAFHFLNTEKEIEQYESIANRSMSQTLIIAGFAADGPLKCSGLEVKRYDAKAIEAVFIKNFKLVNTYQQTHVTPFKTKQKFQFSVFKRRQ